MSRFIKLDPQQKFIATVVAIAVLFPALLLVGYVVSTLIRSL